MSVETNIEIPLSEGYENPNAPISPEAAQVLAEMFRRELSEDVPPPVEPVALPHSMVSLEGTEFCVANGAKQISRTAFEALTHRPKETAIVSYCDGDVGPNGQPLTIRRRPQ